MVGRSLPPLANIHRKPLPMEGVLLADPVTSVAIDGQRTCLYPSWRWLRALIDRDSNGPYRIDSGIDDRPTIGVSIPAVDVSPGEVDHSHRSV